MALNPTLDSIFKPFSFLFFANALKKSNKMKKQRRMF